MYSARKIAVVMPAHNEEGFVGPAVKSVPGYVDAVFLVDDGSDDATAGEAAAAGDSRLEIIRHPVNLGVGAAVATGYKAALDFGADITCVMAGDGQMDPRDMPGLLDAVVEGAGYAKGNRFSWNGPEQQPLTRRVGGALMSVATMALTGLWHVFDSQCGYTAISKGALCCLDLDGLWPRFGYPNDILAMLVRAGVSIVDVPVRPVYGSQGSHLTLWTALRDLPPALARCAGRRTRARRSQVRCGSPS